MLWFDGELVDFSVENFQGSFVSGADLVFGGTYPFDVTSGFKGDLDEIAIFNRDLSPDEIRFIANNGLGDGIGECPCLANVSADGVVDNGDINAFIARFLAGDPLADYSLDGVIDNGDINAFIAAYLDGC